MAKIQFANQRVTETYYQFVSKNGRKEYHEGKYASLDAAKLYEGIYNPDAMAIYEIEHTIVFDGKGNVLRETFDSTFECEIEHSDYVPE